MAVELRNRIGGRAMLDELRRFGFATPSVTLAADSSDADWGDALSIGESGGESGCWQRWRPHDEELNRAAPAARPAGNGGARHDG
jgi:hypothetical protein